MLYVAYAGDVDHHDENAPLPASTIDAKPDSRRSAVIVSFGILAGALVTLIASIIFVSALSSYAQRWANFLGFVSSGMALIQYMPQIYYTYHLGDVKSLSLLTMLIQIPGSFLFAFSLWLHVGWEGWSAWAQCIVTAVLQCTLFVLAMYYTVQQRSSERKNAGDQRLNGGLNGAEADERSALLSNR